MKDRFEDDLRLALLEIAPREAPTRLRQRLVSVSAEPVSRPTPMLRAVRWGAYVLVFTSAVLIGTLLFSSRYANPAPSPSPTPTVADVGVRLDLDGIILEHPPAWEFHEYQFVASMFDVLGYLTTGPFDPTSICTGDGTSVSCNFTGNPIEPGGVSIKFVQVWSLRHESFPVPGEIDQVVGGMPARFTETLSADVTTLSWDVRRPGSPNAHYSIEARIREPGAAELRRLVEKMIASLRFDPPPTILPTAGPAFDEQAAAAARVALDSVRQQQHGEGYECFDPEALGVPHSAAVEVTLRGPLTQPLEVTCTTFVEADVDVWRVRFVMAWAAGADQQSGRLETMVWVGASGDAGGSMSSGDQPPYAACPPACG